VNLHHVSWYPPCTHTLLCPSCTVCWVQFSSCFLVPTMHTHCCVPAVLYMDNVGYGFHHVSWYPPCTHIAVSQLSCTWKMLGTVFIMFLGTHHAHTLLCPSCPVHGQCWVRFSSCFLVPTTHTHCCVPAVLYMDNVGYGFHHVSWYPPCTHTAVS